MPGLLRTARRALAAIVALFALACSGLPAPAVAPTRTPAPPAGGVPTADLPPLERQVMVTLPPGGALQWERVIADLANVYALRPIYKWTMESVGEPCIVFELPENRSVEEMVSRLSSDRRVDIAQPVQLFHVLAEETPAGPYNDPYAHLQHGVETLHLAAAQRWATGKGVKVAVIDTGVDLAHPDLAGRVTRASNFVVAGDQAFTSDVHGTAVAGVIAADANNHEGIVGVAPDAEIVALKACWQDPPTSRQAVCNSYTLAQAVDAAVKEKARVVNFSLAGPPDRLLQLLLENAMDRGAVVVAAADEGEAEGFPASAPGVIAVRAADLGGELRTAPVPGERLPALAAPGVDVLSTVPRGAYDFFTGSSLAAAQVSGVVALLLEKRPDLTAAEIAALLADSARPVGPDVGNPGLAGRLVDACAALGRLLGEPCGD